MIKQTTDTPSSVTLRIQDTRLPPDEKRQGPVCMCPLLPTHQSLLAHVIRLELAAVKLDATQGNATTIIYVDKLNNVILRGHSKFK